MTDCKAIAIAARARVEALLQVVEASHAARAARARVRTLLGR